MLGGGVCGGAGGGAGDAGGGVWRCAEAYGVGLVLGRMGGWRREGGKVKRGESWGGVVCALEKREARGGSDLSVKTWCFFNFCQKLELLKHFKGPNTTK